MKSCHLLILLCVMFVLHGVVCAQTTNAVVTGRVTDPSKAVIARARVTLISNGTNARFEVLTNNAGNYVIGAIPPGDYRIEVEKSGFKTIVETGVVLHTQDAVELNYEMAIGASSESITVNASGGLAPISDSPSVGVLVNRDFVENMPLNGRSLQDLIALAPGAVPANDNSGLFTINGQRDDANYYTVDGVPANLGLNASQTFDNVDSRGLAGAFPSQTVLGTTQGLASLDSLQEFKIQTSGYTAEYGRQPGGQIELTTRSGTNTLHGSVFEYFRNTVFDANSWLADNSGQPIAPEHQNDFGGTLGGPIRVPLLYDGTDKTFFFFSYEGLRLLQPQGESRGPMPTVAFRQFAAPAIQPFLNAFPVPQGQVVGDECAASLDPADQFSCTASWVGPNISYPSSLDSFSIRLDQNVAQKAQLFFRYNHTPSSQSTFSLPGKITANANISSATVGTTVRIRPTLLNDFRFNYSSVFSNELDQLTSTGGGTPYSESLVVSPQYAPSGTLSLGEVVYSIPGTFISPTLNRQQEVRQHQYSVIDDISWTHGAHSLKLGGGLPDSVTYVQSSGIRGRLRLRRCSFHPARERRFCLFVS